MMFTQLRTFCIEWIKKWQILNHEGSWWSMLAPSNHSILFLSICLFDYTLLNLEAINNQISHCTFFPFLKMKDVFFQLHSLSNPCPCSFMISWKSTGVYEFTPKMLKVLGCALPGPYDQRHIRNDIFYFRTHYHLYFPKQPCSTLSSLRQFFSLIDQMESTQELRGSLCHFLHCKLSWILLFLFLLQTQLGVSVCCCCCCFSKSEILKGF